MEIPLTITDNALVEIQNIKNHKNIPEKYGLRVGVKGAGCAGVSYILGFDTVKNDDVTYSLPGVDVHIAKKDTMYLIGLVLDFYEGDDARGFHFSHPDQEVKPSS
ncbi:MAG: iron-sulfur cluster assembly accessory protein [Cyclobacteriaceae bacterium]|nr:iron-sulfur cluster assembly accessory protein [Cyclobacteriaceae bacterium]